MANLGQTTAWTIARAGGLGRGIQSMGFDDLDRLGSRECLDDRSLHGFL